jgi:hypothetical protein
VRAARSGSRTELVAQEGADVLVGDERLGDVAAPAEDLDERGARRLAVRRQLHRPAGRALGLRQLRVAEPGAHERHGLQQLEPGVVEVGPRPVDEAGVEPGQQLPIGERERLARAGPRGVVVACCRALARLPEAGPDRLAVDPGVGREAQRELRAAVEPVGTEGAAQPRQQRPQQRVAVRGRRSGPQRLDELVAPHGPVAVQREVGEQQAALTAGERGLEPLAVPVDLQPTTQAHAGPHRAIVMRCGGRRQGIRARLDRRSCAGAASVSPGTEAPRSAARGVTDPSGGLTKRSALRWTSRRSKVIGLRVAGVDRHGLGRHPGRRGAAEDEEGGIYVLPGSAALTAGGDLACDWRDGDPW